MYNLDTDAAKQADQKGGAINEKGKYIGKFTRAENVLSKKNTQGVEFSFKDDNGLEAGYLTLWTKGADGRELYGYKVLMAIMACLRVKSISPVMRTIEKYNFDTNSKEQIQAEVFPELMDKPIGLLIAMEEYEKQNGDRNWKPTIYAPFEAVTGFTASEILNKSQTPETLEKMIASMRDRPMKSSGQFNGNHMPAGPNTGDNSAPHVGFDGFDTDDIPF
jgi:hypothetical protein